MTLAKDNILSIDDIKAGQTLTFTDQDGTVFNVATNDNNSITYAADTKLYKSNTTATLKVKSEEFANIYTGANSDEYGYYDTNITKIDASDSTGEMILSGSNITGFTITGGKGGNNIYGGGDKSQTMVGTKDVSDVFWFGTGDGQDIANKAGAEDGVNLYNVESIDNVKVTVGSNYFTVNVGTSNLKVNTIDTAATTTLAGFTFTTQDGTAYNYDTTTKSFKAKA